jgi:hypothetical protein
MPNRCQSYPPADVKTLKTYGQSIDRFLTLYSQTRKIIKNLK